MTGLSIGLDLFPLLTALLSAVTCALLGSFLVLRRLSLMGDAISHSVLPGLVASFLIAQSRSPLAMLVGAALAGGATVVLVELVKRLGRVEPGAAMGVVFSILFALGVVLIERAAARHVDLDADCVLHGQLETLVWYNAPATLDALLHPRTLGAVPRQIHVLLASAAASTLFVTVFFKELRIASFDPALASAQGFSAGAMHLALMLLVALATVASFEAVGSILVIAMLICPAATARLLTDRLHTQVWCSVSAGALGAILGYWAASAVPGWFGKDSVNAAGSISVVSGVLLVAAAIASPRHGLVTRWARRRRLARGTALDDLLASIFRAGEAGRTTPAPTTLTARAFRAARSLALRRGLVELQGSTARLTPAGERLARDIVRRHRLWEHYLVDQAGAAPDHVHPSAELLEHVPVEPQPGPLTDPHGRMIPPA